MDVRGVRKCAIVRGEQLAVLQNKVRHRRERTGALRRRFCIKGELNRLTFSQGFSAIVGATQLQVDDAARASRAAHEQIDAAGHLLSAEGGL